MTYFYLYLSIFLGEPSWTGCLIYFEKNKKTNTLGSREVMKINFSYLGDFFLDFLPLIIISVLDIINDND
jgi:hypothetical protein